MHLGPAAESREDSSFEMSSQSMEEKREMKLPVSQLHKYVSIETEIHGGQIRNTRRLRVSQSQIEMSVKEPVASFEAPILCAHVSILKLTLE